MDAERWNQVQTLFKEILELDHDSRVTRLNEVRETDDELFREIQSLLAADADDSSILDGFAIDSIDISGLLSMDGTRVGPFEIERQIGSGGMGNVYLAKRVEGGFEQTVALKLIKYGMDSEQILRRFESERQILARLQHPNIARLVDGGIKDDGRPWFAMDYVQGEPIDEYCNSKDLDIE
ncbi:MAG: serine/threonine protein kinase, partial [Candidatus Halalkalibacterium sp. M3_1C_030]